MPAQHVRRTGRLTGPPRAGVPLPGAGGYAYPRGPYGKTGFPGSTPASARTKDEGPTGRKDRQLSVSANQAEWAALPTRRPNGTPRQPFAHSDRTRRAEDRMTPVIGGAPGSENVRNQVAQRYKARPGMIRGYRPAANPGKTGARLDGVSQYHPDTLVHGHPDGTPIPGMPANPGPPDVIVSSRFVSHEGAQEGYAMNRDLRFAHGGKPPSWPQGTGPTPTHLRGGRLTGTRYFGAIIDQQRIGLDTDAYGIARRRGPRHRPVRFEMPTPHAANYYDAPPDVISEAPDMIHKAPARSRSRHTKVRRG
jgi:hypothetical protein